MLWSTQAYLDAVKSMLPRCLTPEERTAIHVEEEPPAWCIEMAKWPYDTPEWKNWLAEKKSGNATAAMPTQAR